MLDDIMKTYSLESDFSSASEPYWKDKISNYFENSGDNVMDFWHEFNQRIKRTNRYFFNNIDPLKYMDNSILNELAVVIDKDNSVFYRARKGYELRKLDSDSPFKVKMPYKDMGPPPYNLSKGGRANSIGIVCLYLATNIETVISEVRPYKGELVSVAKFKLVENLKVIDFTGLNDDIDTRIIKDSPFKYNDIIKRIESMKFFNLLSIAMSTPINSQQYELEYLPMQYYIEYFKELGFDGILYKSAMGNENNLVLFEYNKVKEVDKRIYKVRDLNYK